MTSEHEIPLDAVAALSAHLLDDGTLDDVLLHICAATVEHLPGADEASVTLLTANKATTYGATSGLPTAADERQYEADTGPCLDAARTNQPVIVEDARTDTRWEDVLPRMVDEGVLSSMSIPLPVQGAAIGALNIYARTPRAFDEKWVGLGQQLA